MVERMVIKLVKRMVIEIVRGWSKAWL
jgi:hypothetical protein